MFIAMSAILIIVRPFMCVTEEHMARHGAGGRRKLCRSPSASLSEANISGRVH
jgi:hypothetical protein